MISCSDEERRPIKLFLLLTTCNIVQSAIATYLLVFVIAGIGGAWAFLPTVFSPVGWIMFPLLIVVLTLGVVSLFGSVALIFAFAPMVVFLARKLRSPPPPLALNLVVFALSGGLGVPTLGPYLIVAIPGVKGPIHFANTYLLAIACCGLVIGIVNAFVLETARSRIRFRVSR